VQLSFSGTKIDSTVGILGRGTKIAKLPARLRGDARIKLPLQFAGLDLQGTIVSVPGPDKQGIPHHRRSGLNGGSHVVTPFELEAAHVFGIETVFP
jgi:hypothetical protein